MSKTAYFLHANAGELAHIETLLSENEGIFESDDMEARFDVLQLKVPQQLERAIKVRAEMVSKVKLELAERIAYFQEWKAKELKKIEVLEKSIYYAVVDKGLDGDFGLRGVKTKKLPTKLPDNILELADDDPDLIPDAFWEDVPATKKLRKRVLLSGIKAKLPGCKDIPIEDDRIGLKFWG